MDGLTSAEMAEKWASFSGDRNPIHFELAVAKRVGASRLVVHGMLALLHVKQEMTQRLAAPDGGQSLAKFNAFFRLPALQGSKTELTFKPKGSALTFDFKAEGQACIRGNACAEPTSGLKDCSSHERRWIKQDDVRHKRLQFDSLFPFVSHPWIFLDALVFSDFLKEHFDNMAALSSNVVPFQMSHRVRLDAALLRQAFDSVDDYPAVSYAVERIGTAEGAAERSGVAIITVQVADRPVMEIEIGLIGKTLPNDQQPLFTN
jgi:hypothetical protein